MSDYQRDEQSCNLTRSQLSGRCMPSREKFHEHEQNVLNPPEMSCSCQLFISCHSDTNIYHTSSFEARMRDPAEVVNIIILL